MALANCVNEMALSQGKLLELFNLQTELNKLAVLILLELACFAIQII